VKTTQEAPPAAGLRAAFRANVWGQKPEREGPPRVLRVDPHDGAVGVFRDAAVVARLTHPVDPLSLSPATFGVYSPAGFVPGHCHASPDGEVLIWRAERLLEAGIVHHVVARGLRDRQGRELPAHTSGFVPCDLLASDVGP